MKRTIISVKIGEDKSRFITRIYSDPCEEGTPLADLLRYRLLESLGQVREISLCGEVPFDKLSMKHDGDQWLVEAEAIAETK